MMEKCKQILKKIFFLPPLLTVLLALFGYGFVLAVAVFEIAIPILQYLSYICSAYALIITITGFPHFIAFTKSVKRYINGHSLMKKLQSTTMGGRFFSDIRFRTEISLYQGLFIKLVKFRKHGSPILSAAKVINLVAAMVSILSLETAMMAQFGGNDDLFFRKNMTAATGGGVCTIVIGMAIFMIWKSAKQMKKLRINNSQT